MMQKRNIVIAGLVLIALVAAGALAAQAYGDGSQSHQLSTRTGSTTDPGANPSAHASAMSTDEPSEATVYTADDDGTSIVLEPGQSFSVVLAGNVTTGYSWQVEGIDAAILTAAEPVYESDSELIGAGGVFTFTFTAAGSGETELRLVYLRPWEQVEPLETFTLTVTVP